MMHVICILMRLIKQILTKHPNKSQGPETGVRAASGDEIGRVIPSIGEVKGVVSKLVHTDPANGAEEWSKTEVELVVV